MSRWRLGLKLCVAHELLVFDDSSHGFVPKDMEQAMKALVEWFKKQLLK